MQLNISEEGNVKIKKYFARAPLRLGLGGGGTDVAPFSDLHGGYILNATISLFAHAILEPLDSGGVIIEAVDLNEREVFESIKSITDQSPLRLHKGVISALNKRNFLSDDLSFKLTTFADAPPGSGLGTSSTMVVCLIKVFCEWLGLPLGEYDIADLAYVVEREELMFAGGKQDQYAAAFGGFNFMEFSDSRVLVNPLRIKPDIIRDLELSTVLYHTGRSRDSATIIEEQVENSKSHESQATNALFEIKQNALDLKAALLRADLDDVCALINASWHRKKELSGRVSNERLDAIYDKVMAIGGRAGKISGAGGGGFFMFLVEPEQRPRVIRVLEEFEGDVIHFTFTDSGSVSWMSS